jgi:hypothetical protein
MSQLSPSKELYYSFIMIKMGEFLIQTQNLENVYELILLLDQLNKIIEREEKWKGASILIPVNLGGLYYIGVNYGRVYNVFLGKAENLRGPPFKEFLPKYWEHIPEILLGKEIWLFEPWGSGSNFKENYTVTEDPDLLKQIEYSIDNFLLERKEAIEKIELSIGKKGINPPKWRKCSICCSIPEKSYAFWKGNDLDEGEIPHNEIFLEIIGAPTFDDSTTKRHWCVKKCPQCHSHFLWRFDYTFLTNGSEDEIWLTRLDESEKVKWLIEIDQKIKAAKKKQRKKRK